jgi:hypothetical protein
VRTPQSRQKRTLRYAIFASTVSSDIPVAEFYLVAARFKNMMHSPIQRSHDRDCFLYWSTLFVHLSVGTRSVPPPCPLPAAGPLPKSRNRVAIPIIMSHKINMFRLWCGLRHTKRIPTPRYPICVSTKSPDTPVALSICWFPRSRIRHTFIFKGLMIGTISYAGPLNLYTHP